MKPIAKQAKMQDANDQSYEELFALISSMNEKLKKLDKLDIIENRLNTIDNEISELKYSLTYQQETATEIQKEQKEQSNKIAQLESTVAKIEEEKDRLSREIVDIRAHSMRNNLMFYYIPEQQNEPPENCVAKVYNILENNLQIESATSTIPIERAHRIGKPRPGNSKPRPIVAKFLKFPDKESIKSSSKKLKGTDLGISDQFPKEIVEKRKVIYPILKKAKDDAHKVKLIKDN
jgi:archaellum component FlaC